MRLKQVILSLGLAAASMAATSASAGLNPFDGKANSFNPSPQAYICLGALTYAMKNPQSTKKALTPDTYLKARGHWSMHPDLSSATPIEVQSEDAATRVVDMDPKKREKLIKRCMQDSGYKPTA